MLRKFLHLFGRHHWSIWTNPVPAETHGGIAAAFSGSKTHGVQVRHCLVCNIYQSNVVEELYEGYKMDTKTLGDLAEFFVDEEEEHADF
jgi:hypothetical protein